MYERVVAEKREETGVGWGNMVPDAPREEPNIPISPSTQIAVGLLGDKKNPY